jgi:hypothetical protein
MGRPYSTFCVTAKVTKLIVLSSPLFLSPTNLITFTGTQNQWCYSTRVPVQIHLRVRRFGSFLQKLILK